MNDQVLDYVDVQEAQDQRLRFRLRLFLIVVAVAAVGLLVLPPFVKQVGRIRAQRQLTEWDRADDPAEAAIAWSQPSVKVRSVASPPTGEAFLAWTGGRYWSDPIVFACSRTRPASGQASQVERLVVVSGSFGNTSYDGGYPNVVSLTTHVFALGGWQTPPRLVSSKPHGWFRTGASGSSQTVALLRGRPDRQSGSRFSIAVEGVGVRETTIQGQLLADDSVVLQAGDRTGATPAGDPSAKIGVDDQHADARSDRP